MGYVQKQLAKAANPNIDTLTSISILRRLSEQIERKTMWYRKLKTEIRISIKAADRRWIVPPMTDYNDYLKLKAELARWNIPLKALGRDLVALIQRPGTVAPFAVYGRCEDYAPFHEIARVKRF